MMEKIKLTWKGLNETDSTEHCEVDLFESGFFIASKVRGTVEGQPLNLSYRIHADKQWQMRSVAVQIENETGFVVDVYSTDGKGHWYHDEMHLPEFDGCMEVDIRVSAFTNSLAINRLKLQPGESSRIAVLYIDVLKPGLKRIEQRYTRIGRNEYLYENMSNNFKSEIEVDHLGLITVYSGIFERTGIRASL